MIHQSILQSIKRMLNDKKCMIYIEMKSTHQNFRMHPTESLLIFMNYFPFARMSHSPTDIVTSNLCTLLYQFYCPQLYSISIKSISNEIYATKFLVHRLFCNKFINLEFLSISTYITEAVSLLST